MAVVRRIAAAAGDGLANRTVHIRVYPRPRNLAESREILRVLEGYGEVVMFKHLKYEQTPAPNSMLAIYQASSSAQKLIDASLLEFKIETKDAVTAHSDRDGISPREEHSEFAEEEEIQSGEPNKAANKIPIPVKANDSKDLDGSQDVGAIGGQLDNSSIGQTLPPKGMLTDPTILPTPVSEQQQPKTSSSQSPSPSQASQPSGAGFREFRLKVSPSHMNHQRYMERQGYYGEFIPDTKTIMGVDLEARVPLAGLSDCHVKKEEVLRIKDRNYLPRPFSLRKLWEEWEQKNEP